MPIEAFFIMRFALFTAELLADESMLIGRFPRRKRFVLRLVICIAVLAAVSVALAFVNESVLAALNYDTEDILLYIVICATFIVLFLLSVIAMHSCYESDLYSLSFCAIFGYCARHLVFSVYVLIVSLACPEYNLFNYGTFHWAMIPVYLVIYTALNMAVYFLFVRRINRNSVYEFGRTTLLLYAVVLTINVVINAISELYGRERSDLYIMGLILQIACMVLVLSLQTLIVDSMQLKSDKKVVDTILEQQEKQFKFAQANAEQISIKAHDLKHQVAVLRAGGEPAEKLLSELEHLTGAYDAVVKTDNATINAVISEKWMYCTTHGIKLSYMVNPKALEFMESVDLYSLIGNIIDNSIEAVMRLSEKNKRVITMNVSEKNGIVTLSSNNYYEGRLEMRDGLPVTVKTDKTSHGYGMRSIRSIVEKYGGDMNITADDGIFILTVTFCRQ